jgi:oligopeptide transport system ATP-binding protein
MEVKLLEVRDLTVEFKTIEGTITAVNKISLCIHQRETVGIAGESGCGKSVTALSIMGLIPDPPGKIVDGEINFLGKNLLNRSENEMRSIRGNDISMIFQEPMSSLNPILSCGFQIAETLMIHKALTKKEAMKRVVELLKSVRIALPEQRAKEYPHQLSGGMMQRVMIAMAIACKPKLLIADEPTTFLDVTIQAQIIELIKHLKNKIGTGIIMITHDLSLLSGMCDRIIIVYAGQVIEEAPTEELFKNPLHPYTLGLLKAIPKITLPKVRLSSIDGTVPLLNHLPPGCSFYPRCSNAMDVCNKNKPELFCRNRKHYVRCWLYKNFLAYRRKVFG